jgi:AraC-like DNA-binding protein
MQTTTLFPAEPIAATAAADRYVAPHLQRSQIFRSYQQAFESTTGLPLALRQPGSFQSPLHGSKQANPFCTLMAASSPTCAACLQLQQRVEQAATSGAKTLQCFAGLNESAVPIRVGENVVGYLQTGQVLLQPPSKARFRRFARQVGLAGDLRQLEAAYFQTRVIAKKQYDSIVRLLTIFAQHLAGLSNQVMVQETTAELPAIAKARAYIAEHRGEELSLVGVARTVNMSECYFCKVFKKVTGLTFTDYVARLRTEGVKALLLNPHARVSEAAFAAGFQSLSQFNRVFRRVAGESPSDYRERLHGPAAAGPGRPFVLSHAA